MSTDRRARRRSPRDRFRLETLERRELMTVQFSSPIYAFGNTTPSAIVTLVRSPNPILNPEVAQVTTTGGTARPDVDYTPLSQGVTFQQGEFTKQVTIPLLNTGQTGDGNRSLVLTVDSQDNLGRAVRSSATVQLIPRADITPPSITYATQLRQKRLLTGFQITFSKDMDPIAASNVKNYVVEGQTPASGGFSLFNKSKSTSFNVVLSRAEYDPATRTVTLTVKRPQLPVTSYTISNPQITGAQGNAVPSALKDSVGNTLDSNGDGQADGLLSIQVDQTTHDSRSLVLPEKAVKQARQLANAKPKSNGFKLPFSLTSRSNSSPR